MVADLGGAVDAPRGAREPTMKNQGRARTQPMTEEAIQAKRDTRRRRRQNGKAKRRAEQLEEIEGAGEGSNEGDAEQE
eukprot:4632291-Pyramimonas_sp.AAC.1